jgi:hypothetical protein
VDSLAPLKLSDVSEPLLVCLDHVLYDPFRRAIFYFYFYFLFFREPLLVRVVTIFSMILFAELVRYD